MILVSVMIVCWYVCVGMWLIRLMMLFFRFFVLKWYIMWMISGCGFIVGIKDVRVCSWLL